MTLIEDMIYDRNPWLGPPDLIERKRKEREWQLKMWKEEDERQKRERIEKIKKFLFLNKLKDIIKWVTE